MANTSQPSRDDVHTPSLFTRPKTAAAFSARTVVLVEGTSDQLALEALAKRRDRNLDAEGGSVVPMGGAHNIGSFLALFGPRGLDVRPADLCDTGLTRQARRKGARPAA
jgi:predicted ATP-dependent endonuclease of OLD family